ncbi:MAG: glycine--tRNA ligase subunit beta [candidate division WOR-3 bacterium]|nr:MAG: glycine--tRNA ligase subunit beta [candidate division WOR-3 bacterium]
MIDFLIEIGHEEFPPSFLRRTADDLTYRLEEVLKRNRIFYRSVRTIYTSRRFGVIVLGLTRKQKPQVIEIQGPPKKIAFDEKNKPTEKLQGFMKTHDLKRTEIVVRKTKKGEYVCGRKEVAGGLTEDVLYEEIPRIIQSLEFPKTMRWNASGTRFPRPVRWIVALLDRRPIRFKYAGITADRYSMPNFHFSYKPIRLEKPREYMNFLRHGGVVVDPNERRKLILKRIKQAIGKVPGKPLYTDAMIDELNCMTEYPEAVTGEFDQKYLDLPEEVIVTVLKTQGDLIWLKPTNKFVCVFSAKKKALQNVKKGYTRVVEAKLYDAHFYYQNDLAQGLEKMNEQTKGMMWLKGLGSLYDKAFRMSKFVSVFPDGDQAALKKAALYCKADLLSQMVREKDFTSLQGIMGGHYAAVSLKDEKIAAAIKEHYLPNYVGDALPRTQEGAALSVADKLDNVIGAFLSGNRPSGSYDPLAVRRNGYGVVQVMAENGIHVSLFTMIERLLGLYGKKLEDGVMKDFFSERMTRYLADAGSRYDEIKAVLATWQGDIADARHRCQALAKFRDKTEFNKLVIGQKRVRNILKGSKETGAVQTGLLKSPAERKLYRTGTRALTQLEVLLKQKKYGEVLELLLSMREVIDTFFDDVMVMCDDAALRKNRLALVRYINDIFIQYADFSEIVIEGEKS